MPVTNWRGNQLVDVKKDPELGVATEILCRHEITQSPGLKFLNIYLSMYNFQILTFTSFCRQFFLDIL